MAPSSLLSFLAVLRGVLMLSLRTDAVASLRLIQHNPCWDRRFAASVSHSSKDEFRWWIDHAGNPFSPAVEAILIMLPRFSVYRKFPQLSICHPCCSETLIEYTLKWFSVSSSSAALSIPALFIRASSLPNLSNQTFYMSFQCPLLCNISMVTDRPCLFRDFH